MDDKSNYMPLRIALYGIVALFSLLLIGTFFFSAVEGLMVVDAFYFAGSTITTLGLGDFVPKTDAGKVFTVIYAFTGVVTIFYTLGKMTHKILIKDQFAPAFNEIKSKGRKSRKAKA